MGWLCLSTRFKIRIFMRLLGDNGRLYYENNAEVSRTTIWHWAEGAVIINVYRQSMFLN